MFASNHAAVSIKLMFEVHLIDIELFVPQLL